MDKITWKRERAGEYVASNGYRIQQFQGDLYPRWGTWEPGQDPLGDDHIFLTGTLTEAKLLVSLELDETQEKVSA